MKFPLNLIINTQKIHKLVASLHSETAQTLDETAVCQNQGTNPTNNANEQQDSGRNTLKKQDSTKAILSEIDSA